MVRWGPILVAVPGAGGGKWIVVGGYSVGRGGGAGFFLVDMLWCGGWWCGVEGWSDGD